MDECCATCKNRLKLRKWDYTHGGCEHSDAGGFACMACEDEGMAIWMVGVNPDTGMCECYVRKDDKHGGQVLSGCLL